MLTTTLNSSMSLPIQMIPLARKTPKWKSGCMDRLEQIGKDQILQNRRLVENYEIIKGKFIFSHYFETEGYADMLTQLTKEFEMPSYLRHYDIISQVINVLSGEYQKRPDNFRVKGFDEGSTNEFVRKKTDMLLKYVTGQINQEVNNKLLEQGMDPDKQDFASEEEQQQYQKELDEARESLTPPEIQDYMNRTWQSQAEQWGEAQLESDKQRFNLAEKEKKEFEDMLTADRCFRHFYLTGDSYGQETWNPVNTFYHKSPEIDYVEEGDYVGRVLYMTPASIINRYGWMMKQSEILKLESRKDTGRGVEGVDGYGIAYGSMVPYENYPQAKIMKEALGIDPANRISALDQASFNNISSGNTSLSSAGYYQVTEAYWQSQRKIGKINYIDEDGILQKKLIDEYFIISKNFKQIDSNLYDTDEENTVVWTWVNQVYGGIKINPLETEEDSLYLGIEPLQFQFKSDSNPYGSKLPVCGQIFNNRNGESMALVDLMKPHQIGFNVAMNQLYQIMQREIGRFIVMDVNMLPHDKDWGGERGWEKFMLVAKQLGMAPVDGSIENMKGANSGGQLPQVVDFDESARMISRTNVANFFEMSALKQVGFNSQRLGNMGPQETATGINQAMAQSFSSTESYFTNFSNYKRRCFTMNLDIAQFVQSQKDEVTVSYTKSDMSRAFMQLNGTELLLRDLGIFITNSQEDIRQLEALRQLALTNNTSDATMDDLATIITTNSPKQIKEQLKKARQHREQTEQQQQSIQQQQVEQQAALQDKQQAFESNENALDRASKEKIAYMTSFMSADDNLEDTDANDTPDILEYTKFTEQQRQNEATNENNKSARAFEREKFNRSQQLEREKMAQDDRELAVRVKLDKEKIKASKNKPKPKKLIDNAIVITLVLNEL